MEIRYVSASEHAFYFWRQTVYERGPLAPDR